MSVNIEDIRSARIGWIVKDKYDNEHPVDEPITVGTAQLLYTLCPSLSPATAQKLAQKYIDICAEQGITIEP